MITALIGSTVFVSKIGVGVGEDVGVGVGVAVVAGVADGDGVASARAVTVNISGKSSSTWLFAASLTVKKNVYVPAAVGVKMKVGDVALATISPLACKRAYH